MRYKRGTMQRRRKLNNILFAVFIILFVSLLALMCIIEKRDSYATKPSEMMEKADYFWKKGDTDKAITQVRMYLGSRGKDVDAWLILASYYDELDMDDKVQECHKNISMLSQVGISSDGEIVLSASNPSKYIKNGISDFVLNISAKTINTSPMQLYILTNNLTDGTVDVGAIQNTHEELDDSKAMTTTWFYVDQSESNYLTLSGAFNTSIWQFKNARGEIVKSRALDGNYNNLESRYTGNKMYSIVEIPDGTVMARVTFWKEVENTVEAGEIFITPGTYPQDKGASYCVTIDIPALSVGESIVYDSQEDTWKLYRVDSTIEVLDNMGEFRIDSNTMFSLAGEVCGILNLESNSYEQEENGISFGVRWDTNSVSPMCERVGDSKNFDYGYYVDSEWIGTGTTNDFDKVSPWADIKLCAIDSDGSILYDGFYTDDQTLDIMVEIPKFFYKREIIEGYEYLWVSPEKLEGYLLDPAFEIGEGIADHIYVGAYLSNLKEDSTIGSNAALHPIINYSLDDIRSASDKKGEKWNPLDLVTLNAIQKLFLVETACKNSQALFMGESVMGVLLRNT